jgi:hypothetical protein
MYKCINVQEKISSIELSTLVEDGSCFLNFSHCFIQFTSLPSFSLIGPQFFFTLTCHFISLAEVILHYAFKLSHQSVNICLLFAYLHNNSPVFHLCRQMMLIHQLGPILLSVFAHLVGQPTASTDPVVFVALKMVH